VLVSLTITGRVVNHDGDTITVLDSANKQHKIRLSGIDAPELGQAYGRASRDNLAEHVAGKAVSIEWNKQDKYGRVVGKVLLDGYDQCLEQVRSGFAWHYKKYEKEQTPEDRLSYTDAEQAVKQAKSGLWRIKAGSTLGVEKGKTVASEGCEQISV
jgi:endonuclease YncB( thermonuclease family)